MGVGRAPGLGRAETAHGVARGWEREGGASRARERQRLVDGEGLTVGDRQRRAGGGRRDGHLVDAGDARADGRSGDTVLRTTLPNRKVISGRIDSRDYRHVSNFECCNHY